MAVLAPFAAAAICQAGIERPLLLLSKLNGVAVPVCGCGVVMPGENTATFGSEWFAGAVEADSPNLIVFILAVPDETVPNAVDAGATPAAGFVELVVLFVVPTRFPIKTFRLLSSLPNSFTRSSPCAFQPSSALGIMSLNPLTSSPSRLDSSSRRLLAAFNSAITDVTSSSAESSFCCRCVSASFNAAVSVLSCSIRSNALVKEASMEDLSDSSCGAVGGRIRGVIYRWEEKIRKRIQVD